MKLTGTEKKLVDQLRKAEQQMHKHRHVLLIAGIGDLAVAGGGFYFLQTFWSKDPMIGAALFSCIMPCLYMVGMGGAFCLGMAIRDWHGNAVRVLLLRLIEEHAEKDDGNPGTAN